MSDMYFEEYDDQATSDFEFIGVANETPVPVVDIPAQVAEIRRTRGSAVKIYVYRNAKECATVM